MGYSAREVTFFRSYATYTAAVLPLLRWFPRSKSYIRSILLCDMNLTHTSPATIRVHPFVETFRTPSTIHIHMDCLLVTLSERRSDSSDELERSGVAVH